MTYYISKIVDYSFDDALIKVQEELKKEGFGVLTEIDVQSTLKNKLNVDFRKYKILGACNPPLAHKAMKAEDKIGVLLPCNVIVQETEDKKIEVAFMNPIVAMQAVKNEALGQIAEEVTGKLKKVYELL
ncbi:MAG: DUF302 domain-containing protein [Ignavibacteriales bacterium]|jgi:uncharacterized protein (DUF302 family)|nr:DUF302 domain-containing protein [Ignavibacteriales bacterium]MBK7980484.1 DUF302 domain-containing protein [Ignavibacteriota bacterium]